MNVTQYISQLRAVDSPDRAAQLTECVNRTQHAKRIGRLETEVIEWLNSE